jgi:hypothetical protein
VRRKPDRMHSVLSLARTGPLSWYHEDEVAEFARARRWTRLREPLRIPRSCISDSDRRILRQPMVVFADQSFLDAAGSAEWPARFHGEDFVWRHLEQQEDSIQAASGSAEAGRALLDDWATRLKKRFDAMYQRGEDPGFLKRIADFMLGAAEERSIRWQAYLRYALVQESEKIRRTFDTFTHHEFPKVPWQSYLDEIQSLSEVLHSIPVEQPHPVAVSSPPTALSKLQDITAIQPVEVYRPAA